MTMRGNPYAPPTLNGIGQAGTPGDYRDQSFDYTFNAVLAANAAAQRQQQSIHNDSDFAWRAIVINSFTGAFSVRFSDSDWYWLSSDEIVSANLQADPASPTPVFPEIIIPAGGVIGMEISDLSGAQNTLQFVFRGVKRYALK